jgi:voltage-gated potassium channel
VTDGRAAPAGGRGLEHRPPRPADRPVWVALRTLGLVIVLLAVYYAAPFDRPLDASTGVLFIAGLAVLALIFVFEIRGIINSSRPRLRAIRALATAVPVLLVLFAATYCAIASQEPNAFNESITRTDGLYFTLTTFATVGYGDIVPKSELARIVVMIQMLVGLITVGVVAKVVVGAVQIADRRRGAESVADDPVAPPAIERVPH